METLSDDVLEKVEDFSIMTSSSPQTLGTVSIILI